MQLQSARRDQGGCARAQLHHMGRTHPRNLPHDMAQEADIGFPASQMGQRIMRQNQFVQQCPLVRRPPARQAGEQPWPADRAEADTPCHVGQAARPAGCRGGGFI